MQIEPGLDAREATALAQSVGWPYTELRVRRTLEMEPAGAFSARDASGALVGMVSAAVWERPEGALAWIGSMVVAERARGAGLGRALLRRAIAYAEQRGARVIGLDATPAGRALYESEGFVAFHESALWARPADAPRAPPGPSGDFAVYPVSGAEMMELLDYDKPRFGANRARLLSRLVSEWPHHSFVAVHRRTGAFSGLALRWDDRVGPLVAEAPEAAAWLLHAIERAGTQPRAIVAEWNADAQAVFARAGYQRERPTLRMFRGGASPGQPGKVYALPVWALG